MEHVVCLIRSSDQRRAFAGLILPDVLPRLEEPTVFLVGAVEGRQPVGAAVLELEPGRAQLLSIAVAEDRRRQGVGSALLRQCVRVLRRTSVQCLYAVLTAGFQAAEALLRAFGMEGSDEAGAYYRFSAEVVASISLLQGNRPGVVPLAQISRMQLRAYFHKVFPADPSVGERQQFDPHISQVLVEQGQITACLLAEREGEEVSLGWLSSSSRDKWALLYLLRGMAAACPPKTPIQFVAYDPAVRALADKLLGDAADKQPVRQWTLSGGRFRLTDTTPRGWEEDQDES